MHDIFYNIIGTIGMLGVLVFLFIYTYFNKKHLYKCCISLYFLRIQT